MVAWQASLSVGFSKQEYWSGLSFPSLKKNGYVYALSNGNGGEMENFKYFVKEVFM